MSKFTKTMGILAFAWLAFFAFSQAQESKPVPAFLISNVDNTQMKPVLILASQEGNGAVKIARNSNDLAGQAQSLENASITFIEPPEYAKGMELLGRAEYAEAAKYFGNSVSLYIRAQHVPFNYSTAARFRYGQCMIYTGNWKSLRDNVAFSLKQQLLPEGMREQASLFVPWLNYGEENWDGLKNSLAGIDSQSLRSAPRSEFEFLQGRLLEQEGDTKEAISTYQTSIALSRMSNPALTKLAADRLLALYLADERINDALKLDSEGVLKEGTEGSNLLKSAGLIHHLYTSLLSVGEQPPAGSAKFAPYYFFQEAAEEAEGEAADSE